MRNLVRYILILILSIAFCAQLQAEKTKQALRALEKGDYEKAEGILRKSMREDTLNPATEYVLALLYTNEDYPNYHLDTAHVFIQYACEHIKLQNEDHLDELDDADLYEYDIKNKKIAIDSMAFARATASNTIDSYEFFIANYFDAADFAKAVSARNQLEFEKVESIHTWQAYRAFMSKFPFASQLPKARIQYDKLVYSAKTASGQISELEDFLIEEPNTPYRHSIEKKIFEDYVGELDTDQIIRFLNTYKNPVFSTRAVNLLCHLDGFDISVLSEASHIRPNFVDSLNRLESKNKIPLAISLRDSVFEFLDLEGNIFLKKSYQKVSDTYKCGNVFDDLLEVQGQHAKQLINRQGTVIFEGHSGQVKDLGNGLLSVEENDKVGLIHKSGFRLLPTEHDNLQLLESSLLVFEKSGKKGVMSVTGKEYIKPEFDNINLKGSFWIFEKEGFFGVSNLTEIRGAKASIFSVDLTYEEVEVISDKYVIGFEEDSEVLINEKLEIISPLNTKRINTRHETWVLELPDGYTTFDPQLGKISSNVYQGVMQNGEWLGLTRNGKWFVYNKNIYDEPIIGVDSLKLLGEDIAIVFRETSGMAIFPNKKVVEIVEDQYLKSIGPKVQTDKHYLVIREQGENILYKDGEEQFRLVCDELGYISDSAFYVKKDGKYGAVDLQGRLVMRIRYDAISQAKDQVAPVLYHGKFGAFNFRDRVLIRMDYQEKLKSYNSNLFVMNNQGKYGLLDRLNRVQVRADYEKIEYWSDSTFLGRKDGAWRIVSMRGEEILLDDVLYFEFIKNTIEEKILLIRKEDGYGVYHSEKGVIIPTVFHDVMNMGNDTKQLYFTETAVPEADIYVVVYYNSKGQKLFSEAYRSDFYQRLVCED